MIRLGSASKPDSAARVLRQRVLNPHAVRRILHEKSPLYRYFQGFRHHSRLLKSTERAVADGNDESCEDFKFRRNFDWTRCLSLAGCSFEAYNDLDQDSEHLSRLTTNGTEISYLSLDFLKSQYKGLLMVRIHDARDLKAMNWMPWTKSDPYIVISCDGSVYKTSTVWGNLNPSWNETAYFYVHDLESTRLRCRVIDDNIVTGDNLMGSTFVPVNDLRDNEEHEVTLPLVGTSGEVRLSLKYSSFKEGDSLDPGILAEIGKSTLVGNIPRNVTESAWRKMMTTIILAEELADIEFDPVSFIENRDTDTQAWIFWNTTNKRIVVAFRGTEQTEFKDLLTDASLIPSRIAAEDGRLAPSNQSMDEQSDPWVHSGFLRGYLSVASEVKEIVQQIVGQERNRWEILFTGHSLGGALTTLCAYDIAKMEESKENKLFSSIDVYNYGSPMVGGEAFTSEFNALLPNCWRIVNENDAVCRLPRFLGYGHVGGKVTLHRDGSAIFMDSNEKEVSEDISVTTFIKKLGYQSLSSFASQGKNRLVNARIYATNCGSAPRNRILLNFSWKNLPRRKNPKQRFAPPILKYTKKSPLYMGAFAAVAIGVPYFIGETVMKTTNSPRADSSLEEDLRKKTTLESQMLAKAQKERLQVLFDEIKDGKGAERYQAALDGQSLGCHSSGTTIGARAITTAADKRD
ncbi:hypothetical protein M9435_001710 [Picochlorum sp. BPE23]|nr:hypothetical protein M9435_001710 [Picochlorum sp. BPE23]